MSYYKRIKNPDKQHFIQICLKLEEEEGGWLNLIPLKKNQRQPKKKFDNAGKEQIDDLDHQSSSSNESDSVKDSSREDESDESDDEIDEENHMDSSEDDSSGSDNNTLLKESSKNEKDESPIEGVETGTVDDTSSSTESSENKEDESSNKLEGNNTEGSQPTWNSSKKDQDENNNFFSEEEENFGQSSLKNGDSNASKDLSSSQRLDSETTINEETSTVQNTKISNQVFRGNVFSTFIEEHSKTNKDLLEKVTNFVSGCGMEVKQVLNLLERFWYLCYDIVYVGTNIPTSPSQHLYWIALFSKCYLVFFYKLKTIALFITQFYNYVHIVLMP